MSSPVRLKGQLGTAEAHILQDALAREGIRTVVRQDHLASADIPAPGQEVELWVGPGDLEAALALIADAEAHEGDTEMRTCGACGEAVPATFAKCWKCEADL